MGDLYMSAIGTTTIQLKEIPPRPPELDAAVCLGEPVKGIDEAVLRDRFDDFISCDLHRSPAVLLFATRDAACAAIVKGPGALGVWLDFQYNERAYDDRGW